MASEIRYIFGDIRTGEVIDEISCQGVTISDSTDGGEFRGTFGLDQTGRSNEDLVAATLPGKTYVAVLRNGVPIWSGINWSRTYQSQAKSIQMYAKSMDQYFTKRFITSDLTYTSTEQRNVFRDLLIQQQADPNGLNLVIPGSFATVTPINFSIAGSELMTYREAMDQITTTEYGFEWRVDVTFDAGSFVWTVVLGDPELGQPLTDASPVFEYPGNVLNYWQNDTIGAAGTHVYTIGAGEGDVMPTVEVIHSDLLAANFLRLDASVTMKEVEDPERLEALAVKQALLRKAPMPVYTVEMKADRTPEFADWNVGDYCKLAFNDPLHPERLQYSTRILRYDYTPPSGDSVEEVRLTFEGEDISG